MNEPLEIRTKDHGVEVVGVSFPDRTIDLVVMPYEHPAMIHEPGRSYEEIVSRGAFDGIEARNGRVRANRDHDVARTIGRVIAFHPSNLDGLVAEVRVAKTVLGEETLELADEGCLDASAGFALLRDNDGRVVPGAEIWENRARCRLNRLYLGHVALTPEPAYETANVLAVRAAQPAAASRAPNLERLELERWQQVYADINSRYA